MLSREQIIENMARVLFSCHAHYSRKWEDAEPEIVVIFEKQAQAALNALIDSLPTSKVTGELKSMNTTFSSTAPEYLAEYYKQLLNMKGEK